jgi:hypothetical protein
MKKNREHNIDIKLVNYKTFRGHDGMRGINADIVYKGQKIATQNGISFPEGFDSLPESERQKRLDGAIKISQEA